jgi:aspartate beta-hydroxylase
MNATVADDSQLRSLLSAAERAEMQGQVEEATRLISAARALAPAHPAVLGAAGTLALRKGDAAEAKALLERSLAADPTNAGLFVNLASSLRGLNDADGEMKALDQALSLDPFFFQALIQKGALLERLGNGKQAARIYQRALNAIPPGAQLPRSWQPHVEHAQKTMSANLKKLDDWLSEKMGEVRSRYGSDDQERVNDCLGAVVGKNRIFVSQPTFSHFPRLPAIQFFDRKDFPWVPEM